MGEERRPQKGDVVSNSDINDYNVRKWAGKKQALLDAYDSYVAKEPGSENQLLTLTRRFLYDKLYGLESSRGFKNLGTSETVDDWVQDSLLDIWQYVSAGRLQPPHTYHGLVNRVAHFDKIDAFNYLKTQAMEKVALDVEVGEDAYTGEVDEDASTENPAIYDERATWGLPSDFTFPRSLLKGIDDEVVLLASELIISGWSMKRIAERYGMTENALSLRFLKLRRRMGIVAGEKANSE